MISDYTPSIGTISHKLYNLNRFWSLINEISCEVEMIFWSESYSLNELQEFIICTMNITNKKSARHRINYFLGNHGINTLVFALYASQFILPAYLASWSGTPETNNNKIVILIHDMKPIYENGKDIKLIPSQKTLSPK